MAKRPPELGGERNVGLTIFGLRLRQRLGHPPLRLPDSQEDDDAHGNAWDAGDEEGPSPSL